MKKVVKVLVSTEVGVDSITNSSHVGISWGLDDYDKSWVIRSKTGNYHGINVGVDSLVSKWERTTKKEYVETALGMEAEVFIFETERELVTWLKS